ncbi:putative RNA-directed DNA polymerase from transposon X-element [Trichonephila inaurata madagascariensis]|uniref:Putative RNA-directed DNA polymerase from transposon X-element n=1 Tax=Trichonephila inaurata madagascariensis TaxID=2747483 RepID=A0A8X6JQJ6_9ARAC|nr:putative RNA-directed DNA polymerase from transposon X-element [Trichonephila inaurata madagascariensis]
MKNAAGRIKVDCRSYTILLESKLMALESLGRTKEKFAEFLEPLVESCLPETVLRAWERSRFVEDSSPQDSARSLDKLLCFLRNEVQSEEMIKLAPVPGWEFRACRLIRCDCSTAAALVNFQDSSVFDVYLKNFEDTYAHSVEVLSQKKIWGFVPKIVDPYTLQELKEKNITLSDLETKEHDIELLLRADVIGNILTGNYLKLSSGVTVVQTKFVCTVIGKTNTIYNNLYSNVVSLHFANFTVTDLWNLDAIGITNPTEDAKRKHAHSDFLNLFKENLSVLPDGRFRLYPIGLSSNIEKAFLQLSIIPEHRDYLRFFLPTVKETKIYRHCRFVFGICSSPFQLSACIDHLLENSPARFDDVTQKLKHSFYVDNCVTGAISKSKKIL